ncbi:hypothetical protein L9F63_006409 [Diploptera punctata]|uniref:Gustatory receptor n=1 Tax=Diploptera punctata TaxID=6984 RepID=A0AAD7ZAP5_DIPPU|nr:hypothetical protein L9F63_006409 [Diploptera punctata]
MNKEKFNSSVKYLYLLSQILGLTPISPFIEPDKPESFNVKCLYIIWSMFWILLTSALGCCVSYVLMDVYKEEPAKLRISVTLSYGIMFLGNVISLINYIVKRNNFPKIINSLWKVDNRLLPRSGVHLYDKEKWCSIKYIAIVLLLYAAIVNSVFWAFEETNFRNIIYDTFENLPVLSVINNLLDSYEEHHKPVSTKSKTQRRIRNIVEDISAESTIRQSDEIQLIKDVYIDLYNTKELINSTYGITIVLQIITCYSLSVTSVIEGIDAATEKRDALIIIFDMFLLAYIFVMLAWILLKCHRVFDESTKIISNVLKLMVGNAVSQDVKSDLNIFLSMMRDMPLQFTPCGLFTLNLPFLCSTVGVICTYVVVMIQVN